MRLNVSKAIRTDSVEPLMDGVPAHDAAWGIGHEGVDCRWKLVLYIWVKLRRKERRLLVDGPVEIKLSETNSSGDFRDVTDSNGAR